MSQAVHRANAARHSVVVPVYNEAEVLSAFHERCTSAMGAIGEEYEIVYVDDGSTDASWERLTGLSDADPHVRLVRLSRNFGHQVAISAGVEYAEGDTVTTIDADLQDPPEVIGQLVEAWRRGADVVYAVRGERKGETWSKRVSASAFYRIINGLSDVHLPPEVGDFRLLSRRAVEALVSMPEQHRYVRGLVAWIGYETAEVRYTRDPRAAGETKYPLSRMIRLATDGILAFSLRPLRLATWMGIGVSALAFVAAVYFVIARIAGEGALVQGWTSLVVIVLVLAGIQLLTVGALGEYVGRIYTEVRQRPLYLVRDVRGFETQNGAAETPPPS